MKDVLVVLCIVAYLLVVSWFIVEAVKYLTHKDE